MVSFAPAAVHRAPHANWWAADLRPFHGQSAVAGCVPARHALEVTQRLALKNPDGTPLFRNSNDKPWTTDAVNRGFNAVRRRMGKVEMKRRGPA
jgi:hypothetical protein